MDTATTKETANANKLKELQQQHGRCVHTTMKNGQLLVFRRPTLDEWEDYQEHLKNRDRLGPTNRELCQRTCVFPESKDGVPPALLKAFQDAPRLATLVTDELGELAEEAIEITVKKG